MPVIIPDNLPAASTLQKENIFTIHHQRAVTQDIRPLRIVIVNLMPTKIATETQLTRALSNSPLQVELTLLKMDSHDSSNVSQEHMASFYKTLEEVESEFFDGMILTGAPVEMMPFEEVDYWKELTDIFEWANHRVHSSIFICWGAQAALYHYYGIGKVPLEKKMFGVFPQTVMRPWSPLVRGFDEVFYAPQSRHTSVDIRALRNEPELRVIAESPISGPHIVATDGGKRIFIMGHQEYDKETLNNEYVRDLTAGKPIEVPYNYYEDDDPSKAIKFQWRSHATLLFSNWLNYYVYQTSPYDITEIEKGIRTTFDGDEGQEVK